MGALKNLALFVLLCSCAMTAQEAEKNRQFWLGKTQAQVIDRSGIPDSTFVDGSGNEYYIYDSYGGMVSHHMPNTTVTTQAHCRTIYTFDQKKIVINKKFEGKCK